MNSIGGRKFFLSMFVVVLSSLLVALAKISDGVYATVTVAIIGAYIAGNVMQKNAPTTKD